MSFMKTAFLCTVVVCLFKVCSAVGGSKPSASADDAAADALRDRSMQCDALVLEGMQLRKSVRNGDAHWDDALVRLGMIEADEKEAGCQHLDADKVKYIVSKHAAPVGSGTQTASVK